MYRFLLTPRWLGILALTLAAAAVMVLLGNWQLSRYHERAAINDRIDRAGTIAPVPLAQVLPTPDRVGAAGQAPVPDAVWTRVTVVGRYDTDNVVLVRSRTVAQRVGFEVLTPLVLADGSAVLVDRGWVPPAPGGAQALPQVPDAPTGTVTVVGRVRGSESGAGAVTRREGRLETRRIGIPALAGQLPYPLYGGYVLLDEQDPPADPSFATIPIRHENDWQNGGYVVQWWIFALMALAGFVWAARREAHARRTAASPDRPGAQAEPGGAGDPTAGRRALDESAEPATTARGTRS